MSTTEFVFHLVENEKYAIVYDFSDISEVRSALLSGVIAGGAGAIAGSILAKSNTTTQSIEVTRYIINVAVEGLSEPISTSVDSEYSANLILQMLSAMISAPATGAEDDGIITQEEFETKKKKRLDFNVFRAFI